MSEDPLVLAVRKIKEKLAAKFQFDVGAMMRAQQAKERKSGKTYFQGEPRLPQNFVRESSAKYGSKKTK